MSTFLHYARNIEAIGELFIPLAKESIERYYTYKDENYEKRGPYRTHPLEATKSMGERKNLVFPITAPDGFPVMPKRQWLWSPERVNEALSKDEIAFIKDKDGKWSVHSKQYLKDEDGILRQAKAFSIIDNVFTQHGTNEIIELFGDAHVFPFPKPWRLLEPLLNLAALPTDSIILDFFAGSGTTAQAVIELNKADGGNRQFILVQLPEPTRKKRDDGTWEETTAWQAGYATIADIAKERVRRVIQKLNKEDEGKLPLGGEQKQDRGFKVFKLAESNFKAWNANVPPGDVAALQQQLELHIDHIRDGRTAENILYEILLKSGFPLTTPVEQLTLAGKTVYSAAGGALFICLERELTLDLIRAMAEHKPERVVCLDNGFALPGRQAGGNDQLKANAVQIFKTKGVTSFRTV